jgi:protein transport protein SEC24
MGIPTTGVLGTTFRGADLESQFNLVARRAAAALPTSSLVSAREALTKQCVDVLYVYRRFCATASNPGQLILPEALKLLPLYMLALDKAPPFRCGCGEGGALRAWWRCSVVKLCRPKSCHLLMPGAALIRKTSCSGWLRLFPIENTAGAKVSAPFMFVYMTVGEA